MTAQICNFPVAVSEGDEIERLRASMKEWHTMYNGGGTPLCALVWHEVDAAMKSDDLPLVHNAASALEEFEHLRGLDIPF